MTTEDPGTDRYGPGIPTLQVSDLIAFLDEASAQAVRRDVILERGQLTDSQHTDPLRMAVGFAAILRRAGIAIPVGSVVAFAEALGVVGMAKRSSVYWAGRGVLIRRPEDIDLYDRVFAAYWMAVARMSPPEQKVDQVSVAFDDSEDGTDDDSDQPETDEDQNGETMTVRFSSVETLREKDFATYTDAEFSEARRLMVALKLAGSTRPCRRRTPSKQRAHTNHPDLRRTVRQALKTDGVPMQRRFLEQADKPRRIVFLCDVSGSMESYSRALLRFCQAAVVGRGRVEAFALGTRLTRLTKDLSSRDPDTALRKAAARVVDWSGGTRLGEGMRTFNDRWGVRGMARGSIVVILSDGWDRGEPALLAEQMERLHRIAYRVVWVNPLKASPGYAPLARGMAAALPFIDVFLEGHSFGSLEVLAEALA